MFPWDKLAGEATTWDWWAEKCDLGMICISETEPNGILGLADISKEGGLFNRTFQVKAKCLCVVGVGVERWDWKGQSTLFLKV